MKALTQTQKTYGLRIDFLKKKVAEYLKEIEKVQSLFVEYTVRGYMEELKWKVMKLYKELDKYNDEELLMGSRLVKILDLARQVLYKLDEVIEEYMFESELYEFDEKQKRRFKWLRINGIDLVGKFMDATYYVRA